VSAKRGFVPAHTAESARPACAFHRPSADGSDLCRKCHRPAVEHFEGIVTIMTISSDVCLTAEFKTSEEE
jgi:hypothetical protein